MSLRSFFVNLKEYLNLNALPVPLLRQVYFSVFFAVFFECFFGGGLVGVFLCFVRFLGSLGGSLLEVFLKK